MYLLILFPKTVKIVLIVSSFFVLFLVSTMCVQAVDSRASTYALRDDTVITIDNVDYSINNGIYHITVTATNSSSGYQHYCNLIYTYDVIDSTMDHLDWSDNIVEYIEPTSVDGSIYVYDLDITADCVIAINLLYDSNNTVSAPMAIYLNDFPSVDATEVDGSEVEPDIICDNAVKYVLYLCLLMLIIILAYMIIK